MGFASTGVDNNIFFYDMYQDGKETQKRNEEKTLFIKEVRFSCLSVVPGQAYDVLAVGSDKESHQIFSNTGREVKGNPN